MATGPEHYREAEKLLAGTPKTAEDRADGIEGDNPWPPSAMDLAAAQVHAVLALAAATGLNDADGGMSVRDYNEWRDAAGSKAEVASG